MTEASLPYAGTSGHSGTDTSRERAEKSDSTGKTNKRQKYTLALLGGPHALGDRTWGGMHGVTVKELREATGWHHGVASSVLTNLHISGQIARLEEKRDRCHVYVVPRFVAGRALSPYTPNKRNRKVETDADTTLVIEKIEEEAFQRGMQAATEEPEYAWASEAKHDADKVLAQIEEHLRERDELGTSVVWLNDLRKILAQHRD